MSEVFLAIIELAEVLGVTPLNTHAGCWETQVSEGWWLAVNGHETATKCSHNVEVPPFTVYVEWYGWPAGMMNPRCGQLAAGSEANEDTLIAALESAIGRAKAAG